MECVFASIAWKIRHFNMPYIYNNNFEFWNSYKYYKQNTGTLLPIPIFTGVSGNSYKIPLQYKLAYNYLDPFTFSTILKYPVQQTSKVTIKVFDVLGKELETLVIEEISAGIHELTRNASNLPGGI